MNTIRLCFTATVRLTLLVVAIGSRGAFFVNAETGWKCCPWDRLYDPEMRFCRPNVTDREDLQQRMAYRLKHELRIASYVWLMTLYPPLYCDETKIFVDVPTVELRGLFVANRWPIGDYCFDITRSDELVARRCRPRDQYCGRANYTCVNKCCVEGYMYDNENRWNCKYGLMPFTLPVYETDAGGSPADLSNNTVLPFYSQVPCHLSRTIYNNFILTADGNLHVTTFGGEWIIPETNYCFEYQAYDGPLEAHVCSNAKPPPGGFGFWVILPASVVCLVLTLILYATLTYLRNAHDYYVMFFMACQLMYFVCETIMNIIEHDLDSPLCIPFGYFSLFATLTTCCWLNIIWLDIYWMLKYNNSTNRNTSKSVRTIMYHIYCWGFSSIIVFTGYLFQHSQNKTLRKLAPDIGQYKCNFYILYRYGTLIFYYVPTCGTLTAIFILFLLNAIRCSRIKTELKKFKRTDSKTEMFLVYKERFVMSIKLLLVFGIPFLFRMLCELFNIGGIIWKIINRIYYLQGVFLLFIFVAECKKFRRPIVHSEMTTLNNIPGLS